MAPSTNRSGHRPFKAAMLGSNPAGVTNIVPWCSWLTYLPVTQEIAGSIPVGTATRPLSLIGQDAGLSILRCRVQTPQGLPFCRVVYLARQRLHTPHYAGSSPAPATIRRMIPGGPGTGPEN